MLVEKELSGDFFMGYIQTDGRDDNSDNVYRRMLSKDEISDFTYVKSITSHSYVKKAVMKCFTITTTCRYLILQLLKKQNNTVLSIVRSALLF